MVSTCPHQEFMSRESRLARQNLFLGGIRSLIKFKLFGVLLNELSLDSGQITSSESDFVKKPWLVLERSDGHFFRDFGTSCINFAECEVGVTRFWTVLAVVPLELESKHAKDCLTRHCCRALPLFSHEFEFVLSPLYVCCGGGWRLFLFFSVSKPQLHDWEESFLKNQNFMTNSTLKFQPIVVGSARGHSEKSRCWPKKNVSRKELLLNMATFRERWLEHVRTSELNMFELRGARLNMIEL